MKASAISKIDDQPYKTGSFAAGLQQCVSSRPVYQTQEEIWHSRSTYEAGLASLEARFLQETNFDEDDVHSIGNYKPFLLIVSW